MDNATAENYVNVPMKSPPPHLVDLTAESLL
jgi:hypothetical protein